MLLAKQQIFAKNVGLLLEYICKCGYSCTLGDAYRSPEAAAIYAQQGKGIKDSLHTHKLAIDINLFDENNVFLKDFRDYEKFGIYWKSLNKDNCWGGSWVKKDADHFSMKSDLFPGIE